MYTRRDRSRDGAFKGGGQVHILKITANDFIHVADYWENKATRAVHEH